MKVTKFLFFQSDCRELQLDLQGGGISSHQESVPALRPSGKLESKLFNIFDVSDGAIVNNNSPVVNIINALQL